MGIQIIGLLRVHLRGTPINQNNAGDDTSSGHHDTKLFLFTDSAYDASTLTIDETSIFTASPYNIIPIYLSILRFNCAVVQSLPEEYILHFLHSRSLPLSLLPSPFVIPFHFPFFLSLCITITSLFQYEKKY